MRGTAEQLRGNLKGFKRAVRRRDLELERLKQDRAAVIEECLQKIEFYKHTGLTPNELAATIAAIRALKDKP